MKIVSFGDMEGGNNLSELTNPATARSNLELGSAALLPSSAVAQTANNLSDLASAATARTNLGLGASAVLGLATEGDISSTDKLATPYVINRTIWDPTAGPIDVKRRFGVSFDDSSDDADAWDDVWTYVESITSAKASLLNVNGTPSAYANAGIPILQLPPGVSHTTRGWSPAVTAGKGFLMQGHGPNGTAILLEDDIYFIEFPSSGSANKSYLGLRDLKVVGGLGAYMNFKTTAVGQLGTYIQNCIFSGYKQCAIGSLWGDDPGWWVQGTRFLGSYTGGMTIGMYIPRVAALVDVRGCAFSGNTYGIKTAGGTSGFQANWNLGPSNTFLAINSGQTEADIWFTTIPDTGGAGGYGENVRVLTNRFSNENLDGHPRILIAAEDTGTGANAIEHPHSTSVTTQVFRHMLIEDNIFDGTGSAASGNSGVVKSYTSDVGRLAFRGGVVGPYYPWLVEFASGVATDNGGHAHLMEFSDVRSVGSAALPPNTNLPGYGLSRPRSDGSIMGAHSAVYW